MVLSSGTGLDRVLASPPCPLKMPGEALPVAGRGVCGSVRSSPDGTGRETRPKRSLLLLEGRGRARVTVTRLLFVWCGAHAGWEKDVS